MPTVRRLCTALGAPAAPPHIFAGVSSILTLPAPLQSSNEAAGSSEPKRDKIPAIIIAVYLLVTTRLSGIETSVEDYNRIKSAALRTLNGIDAGKTESEEIDGKDVDKWLWEIRDRGWTSLDWFANIGVGTGLDVDGLRGDNVASEDGTGSEQGKLFVKQSLIGLDKPKKNMLQAGLGTMVGSPQVDIRGGLKLTC